MAAKVNLTQEQKAMVRDTANEMAGRTRLSIGAQKQRDAALKQHVIDAVCREHGCQMSTSDARNYILEEALNSIAQWAEAYPFEVFPEPDFGRAAELLKAGGITIDSVAASCMRRVVQGVGKIAKEALDAK